MSHRATNWAVQVRGIKPAAKVVLWHLADRHNKDTGRCDPSQALLAEDCEMSRSAVNSHLTALEKAGLITRIQRVNSATKRQESTAYILNFEVKEPQDAATRVQKDDTEAVSRNDPDPCPENGESRVRNQDTNPVREPVKNLARTRAVSSGEDYLVQAVIDRKPFLLRQVSPSQARKWVSQGRVSEDQCKEVGVL